MITDWICDLTYGLGHGYYVLIQMKYATKKSRRRQELENLPYKSFLGLVLFACVALVTVIGVQLITNYFPSTKVGLAQGQSNVVVVSEDSNVVNQDGGKWTAGGNEAWVGTGENVGKSYLGLQFGNLNLPEGVTITQAKLEVNSSKEQWIDLGYALYGDKSNSGAFSKQSKLDTRALTSASVMYSANKKWVKDQNISIDVTDIVRELNSQNNSEIRLIAKGTSSKWARKFIYTKGDKAPKLSIDYVTSVPSGDLSPAPTRAVPTPTGIIATPTVRPTVTLTPRPTSTVVVTSTPSLVPTNTPSPTPTMVMSNGDIFGQVSAEILGNCSSEVHDKYVVRGPDGVMYRTWHLVNVTDVNGSKCTFGHEHGDDPSTSKIYTGTAVPFGYIANQIGMDEPHVGFKCFVGNAGTRNDEGRNALHDSYFCFHMGTGGPARFGARFHSMDFKMITNDGRKMFVQGMADTGNVGTICNNPRNARTVMGFGCKVDSSYEIWENTLRIKNQGNTIGVAIASTAVFDPITVMDPNNITRSVFTWSDEAKANIFKFNDDRSYYRGCNRESYHGPAMWYNSNGSTVYYTDAYGNVSSSGVLKQEISKSGYKDFVATNDGLSQFKFAKSYCAVGLGLKN